MRDPFETQLDEIIAHNTENRKRESLFWRLFEQQKKFAEMTYKFTGAVVGVFAFVCACAVDLYIAPTVIPKIIIMMALALLMTLVSMFIFKTHVEESDAKSGLEPGSSAGIF